MRTTIGGDSYCMTPLEQCMGQAVLRRVLRHVDTCADWLFEDVCGCRTAEGYVVYTIDTHYRPDEGPYADSDERRAVGEIFLFDALGVCNATGEWESARETCAINEAVNAAIGRAIVSLDAATSV